MQSKGARVCQETHFHSRQVHVARTLRHLVYTRIIRVAEPVRRSLYQRTYRRGVCVSPFQRGMLACIHLIPRIRTIKGGKFWNVEQRKNTWSNRRARDQRGLHGYSGTVILLLWLFFFSSPWPDQKGMWTIHFLSYARIWNENDEYLAKLKRAQNMNCEIIYSCDYLIN